MRVRYNMNIEKIWPVFSTKLEKKFVNRRKTTPFTMITAWSQIPSEHDVQINRTIITHSRILGQYSWLHWIIWQFVNKKKPRVHWRLLKVKVEFCEIPGGFPPAYAAATAAQNFLGRKLNDGKDHLFHRKKINWNAKTVHAHKGHGEDRTSNRTTWNIALLWSPRMKHHD